MFQEFPKMLYKGDQHRVATDAEQEAAGRAAGWHDFGAEPQADPAQGAEGEKPAETEKVDQPKAQGKKAKAADPAQGAEG